MNTEAEKGTEVPVAPVQQTPTPTEDVATLKAELERAKAIAEEKEKGFKSLQEKLSERDKKLRELSNFQDELQAVREDNKLLAGYVASAIGRSEDDYERAKANPDALIKSLEEKEKQRKVAKQQQEVQQRAESLRQRVESLGLTPEDDEYHDIRGLVYNGNFEYAEHKVKKLEEKKKVPETQKQPENKETEEQRIDRLVKEKMQKLMEEKGLLVSDSGTPASGVSSYAKAADLYAQGKISREEFEKHRT